MNFSFKKAFGISALVILVLSVLLVLAGLKACRPCTGTNVVRYRIDTIKVMDQTLQPVTMPLPVPRKTLPVITKIDTVVLLETKMAKPITQMQAFIAPCDSLRIYSDTSFAENNYRLVINDTVLGQIMGRSLWHVNLKPEVVKTIEKTQPEKVRFYAGLNFTINASHTQRWGLGPSALLTIPQGYGFSYYYDVHNNAHSGGVWVLIRLKK